MVVVSVPTLGTIYCTLPHTFDAGTRDPALFLGIGRSGLNNVRATTYEYEQ